MSDSSCAPAATDNSKVLDAPCVMRYPGRQRLLCAWHRESESESHYNGEVSDERRAKLVRRLRCPVGVDAQTLQEVLEILKWMVKHPEFIPGLLHNACKELDLFCE